MGALIDISGQRFSRLIVVKRTNGKWECKCDCGKTAYASGPNIRSGRQRSCGCLDSERKLIHGKSNSTEYQSWKAMKNRCYRKSFKQYADYGGRGIRVCERWVNSFENFLADMGEKPSEKHTLDRIDINSDYEPSNCRWVDYSEQIINQRLRHDNTSGHKGVSWDKTFNKWHAYISPGHKQKRIHLGYFDDLEQAIQARKEAESKLRSPS